VAAPGADGSADAWYASVNDDDGVYSGLAILQPIDTCPGATFSASVRYKFTSDSDNCYLYFFINDVNSNELYGETAYYGEVGQTDFQTMSFTFTVQPTDGPLTVKLQGLCVTYSTGSWAFDSASVMAVVPS
jgi:hypothetical protein